MHRKSGSEGISETLFSIGKVAKMLNISVATIRFYERKGLIIPIKSKSGRRFYSFNDIIRLRQIREIIIDNGMNLSGIKYLLSMIPCWEFKGGVDKDCKQCPVLFKVGEPCWNIKNVGPKCRNENCKACLVYQIEISSVQLKEVVSQGSTRIQEPKFG